MKNYLFKDISYFVKNKTGIFIFFHICLILTSFVTMYIYSQYETSGMTNEAFAQLKDSVILIRPDESFSYDEFEKIIAEHSDEVHISSHAYRYSANIPPESGEQRKKRYLEFVAYPDNEKETVNSVNSLLYQGEGLSDKELKNGDDVCVIAGKVPDFDIVIQGKKYKIGGAYDLNDQLAYGIIPYSSAKQNNFVPESIIVRLKSLDKVNYISASLKAVDQLKEIFPNYTIETMIEENSKTISKEFTGINTLLIMMLILVFITICCLYSYLYKLRERTYAVFKICGAVSDNIVSICIGEMMILLLPSYFVAYAVFWATKKYILYKYQAAFLYVSDLKTFALCFAFMFVAIMIIFGGYITIQSKKSPKLLFTDSFDMN